MNPLKRLVLELLFPEDADRIQTVIDIDEEKWRKSIVIATLPDHRYEQVLKAIQVERGKFDKAMWLIGEKMSHNETPSQREHRREAILQKIYDYLQANGMQITADGEPLDYTQRLRFATNMIEQNNFLPIIMKMRRKGWKVTPPKSMTDTVAEIERKKIRNKAIRTYIRNTMGVHKNPETHEKPESNGNEKQRPDEGI